MDSFIIRNFRIFQELKIEKLSRVNLFVGKNNVGKSCLLEAFRVYGSGADPGVLYDLVAARDENWKENIRAENHIAEADESPLRYLFCGYRFPENPDYGIELGSLKNEIERIRIRVAAYQFREDESKRRVRVSVKQQDLSDDVVDAELGLKRTVGGEDKFLLSLTHEYHRTYNMFPPHRAINKNIQFIPTSNMSASMVAYLWDQINLTDMESKVLDCLQLIDDRVEGVALIGEKRERIPVIRLKGVKERIPLKTLGDGMNRLFQIILGLVNAKDGMLLIDEFENGLHWTVQPLVWKAVFKISEYLNVQIMATSHSKDCVRGFHEIWSEMESSGTFHRLERDPDNGNRATRYSSETLLDAIETDVEVR